MSNYFSLRGFKRGVFVAFLFSLVWIGWLIGYTQSSAQIIQASVLLFQNTPESSKSHVPLEGMSKNSI
jgi:hypothetical protein